MWFQVFAIDFQLNLVYGYRDGVIIFYCSHSSTEEPAPKDTPSPNNPQESTQESATTPTEGSTPSAAEPMEH